MQNPYSSRLFSPISCLYFIHLTTNTFSFLSGVWMFGDVILAWDDDPFNQLTNLQTEDKFKPVNTGMILDPYIS